MSAAETFDVVVVGAGLGGVYAAYKFRKEGLKVVVLEKADQVGGVWNYNRYPGARVDIASLEYCYSFSPELYREWRWSERYAPQQELQAYLAHVVERFDLGPHIRLNTAMTAAQWRPDQQRYHITAGDGSTLIARFLVMATGNLSEPRDATIPGLADFKGEVVRSSRWPKREVRLAGRRVGIIGTGSSSVQMTTVAAHEAEHLYVFQKTAHYSVPAQNGPLDLKNYEAICTDPPGILMGVFRNSKLFGAGQGPLGAPKAAADYSPAEQQERLQRQWDIGGMRFHVVFADQTRNKQTNDIVAAFVHNKIRQIVKDPVTAEKLCPKYPIGTRRLIQADGYYDCFNRDNVSLVDIAENPIVRVTETGIQTTAAHHDLDLIVLALGFKAFIGEINGANITNEKGETPTSHWASGPRTLLGLMTAGFPNMFMPTGPGSPSVLANLFPQNEYHIDWIADCIRYLDENGYGSIEPELEAQDRWTARVAEVALPLLRLQGTCYMVHRNDDGTRVFIPWSGGVDAYGEVAEATAASGYTGLTLTKDLASAPKSAVMAIG